MDRLDQPTFGKSLPHNGLSRYKTRISGTASMPYSTTNTSPDAQEQVDDLVPLPLEVLELEGGEGEFGEHEDAQGERNEDQWNRESEC